MAVVRIHHQPHPGAIAELYLSRKIGENMYLRGLLVESAAKRLISGPPRRVDSGRLRSSIGTSRIIKVFNGIPRRGARVGTNVRYARWVHDGTGLYGPRHRLITPTTKQFLRFTPKGSTKVIFRRSVKGMRPNQFLKKALPAARLL